MLENRNSVEEKKRKCKKGRNDHKKKDNVSDHKARTIISLYNSQNRNNLETPKHKCLIKGKNCIFSKQAKNEI